MRFELEAGQVPILIGEPGVGKSAFATSLAANLNAALSIVYLAHREASEIHGIPVVSDDRLQAGSQTVRVVTFAPPDYAIWALQQSQTGRSVVILFDEFSCLAPEATASALAILSEKRIGDVRLDPSRVAMIACANPVELAAGGWRIAPPAANRLAWYKFPVDPMEWVERFPLYWGRPPVVRYLDRELPEDAWASRRIRVAAFVRAFPDLLIKVPASEDARSGPWPSPRSWDAVSRVLTVAELADASEGVVRSVVSAHVGADVALKFFTWWGEANFPAPEEVLANESLWSEIAGRRSDQVYYIVSSVVAAVESTVRRAVAGNSTKERSQAAKDWATAVRFLDALVAAGGPKDVALLGAGRLVGKDSSPHWIDKKAVPSGIFRFAGSLREIGLDWSAK
ncbi:MAG: ATP-binding protein [candidate division KSB1 bacterium]|nr:ATP-binding protein [candidate division KSB1 bacterium]